jgi:DNA modification methylase
MQIEKININKLKAAKYNPRKDLKPGDPEFEKLKRSIENFGYVEPIIWNKQTGNVVGGHQRLKILKHLGETEIDCVIVDVDLTKEKALNVALNKISGEWDMPLLSDLMKELQAEDFDVTLTGFDLGEISDLFKSGIEEKVKEDDFDVDKAAEEIKEPISKQGDIWILGKHRLMCGDSTNSEAVKKLMDGKLADLLLTDPPYNVAYEGTAGTIKNDNMEDKKFKEFLLSAFSNAKDSLKLGGSFYIWHADSEGYNFRSACRESGLMVRQCLVWKKSSLVMGRQDYQWRHEPCLYGWKDGDSHYWGSDRKQTTILEFDKPTKNALHPTMKPVNLFAYQILNSSKVGETVLDLFAGSGTAIIASEQTERVCFSMEYDEKFSDIIVKRVAENFGDKDIFLIRDGQEIPYKDIKNKA